MGRIYVIDAYNFVLQDGRLDRVVAEEGLEAARRTFRLEAEGLARRAGCRIRLIYDGARGPFEHVDLYENQYIEVSFTSTGEQADERVVAVALEMVRRGGKICVVSDDEDGVRRPLRATPVTLLGTRDFARLMRPRPEGESAEQRAGALSDRDRDSLARGFLARDAAPGDPPENEDADWAEIPRVERPPAPDIVRRVTKGNRPAVTPIVAARPSSTPASPPPSSGSARPAAPDPADRQRARKERGARKQAKRLARQQAGTNRLQSSTRTHSKKKPKR